MKSAIPARWDAPGMDALPSLAQVDFAVVRHEGRLVPRLIELQGFPSLSAFEVLQADAWNAALGGVPGLAARRRGARTSRASTARGSSTSSGGRSSATRIPPRSCSSTSSPSAQKTSIDFAATRALLGVESVDPRALVKEGRRLFRDGRRPPRAGQADLQPHRLRRAHPDRRGAAVRFPRGARRPLGPAPELVLDVVEGVAPAPLARRPFRRRRSCPRSAPFRTTSESATS